MWAAPGLPPPPYLFYRNTIALLCRIEGRKQEFIYFITDAAIVAKVKLKLGAKLSAHLVGTVQNAVRPDGFSQISSSFVCLKIKTLC